VGSIDHVSAPQKWRKLQACAQADSLCGIIDLRFSANRVDGVSANDKIN
jgi:hypothetical protein